MIDRGSPSPIATLDPPARAYTIDRELEPARQRSPEAAVLRPGLGKIFWTSFGEPAIFEANLDGTGVATTLTIPPAVGPSGSAVEVGPMPIIPEPGDFALAAAGIVGVLILRRSSRAGCRQIAAGPRLADRRLHSRAAMTGVIGSAGIGH